MKVTGNNGEINGKKFYSCVLFRYADSALSCSPKNQRSGKETAVFQHDEWMNLFHFSLLPLCSVTLLHGIEKFFSFLYSLLLPPLGDGMRMRKTFFGKLKNSNNIAILYISKFSNIIIVVVVAVVIPISTFIVFFIHLKTYRSIVLCSVALLANFEQLRHTK